MSSAPALTALLAFDRNNRLAVRALGSKAGLAFSGIDERMAVDRLTSAYAEHTTPRSLLEIEAGGRNYRVFATQVQGESADAEVVCRPMEQLTGNPDTLAPSLAAILEALEPHFINLPYLHLGENEFIYKFRPEKERNPAIYASDEVSSGLYQSQLCAAIKALARRHERSATSPVTLDFGAVEYIIPSHFGFCLGVKNAIERAYETLAANPGKRVFMLSELIHNPFVNEDLCRRGLRYLQTDKGVPFTITGLPATAATTEPLIWDTLTPDDIVIIPAFGATNEDKARLVKKGLAVYPHDATCMLVEKVWKAARSYGREGYTVVIHGKAEHEETKATFSNTRRHAPAVIVRNLAEVETLAKIIESTDPAVRASFYETFAGKYTEGFDVDRDLERVAVVNQTTLLMNETLAIIERLRGAFTTRFGDAGAERVGGGGRRDTLCYATQVNQDALGRALAEPLDTAFVIGGKNSSNTYQLHRLCADKLDAQAFFIQSERNILAMDASEHFVFPAHGPASGGHMETRPLWHDPAARKRVLITGGASCPDGLIQQVITRLNGFFPPERLRSIEAVLHDLECED
ncbi:4-hydroxy-3-methylbut-2-enyl diphosphate reductase [Synoicihabitans lomoniglobus]|uniref:4-hydroxy-3-methylbut-2-enyl diphosphate reductase n=1 Tax=Synoicihabitans lomoniglobus TaxID=2909285 RepID=A0AAF0I5J6_9BACT|nr:4-hydroxy-3-methylbut-2-enyl diphosphate reductase [Opitutaceae bacterium LMO-M01]WED67080.1 4-hydroxy-3-methylbut-2-enyl diphosphate reductase [Opitutaceae bacterium LMO-M01]